MVILPRKNWDQIEPWILGNFTLFLVNTPRFFFQCGSVRFHDSPKEYLIKISSKFSQKQIFSPREFWQRSDDHLAFFLGAVKRFRRDRCRKRLEEAREGERGGEREGERENDIDGGGMSKGWNWPPAQGEDECAQQKLPENGIMQCF